MRMYVERIKYQTEKEGNWNVGYYIGKGYNSNQAAFLDKNYNPIEKDIWDYKGDYENRIVLSVQEKEDFEE